MINELSTFYFVSKKQKKEWLKYLKDRKETHQEALTRLIDREIKHNEDINNYFEKIKGEQNERKSTKRIQYTSRFKSMGRNQY